MLTWNTQLLQIVQVIAKLQQFRSFYSNTAQASSNTHVTDAIRSHVQALIRQEERTCSDGIACAPCY